MNEGIQLMKFTVMTGGLGLAALILTGCAGPAPEAPPAGGSTPSENPPPAGAIGVCDILSADDVSAQFGANFGSGTPRIGEVTDNGVTWSTAGCSWESGGVEVVASVATGDDFAAGFECVEPGSLVGDVSVIDGLADRAWWTWDDFQGGKGTVIACTGDTRVEVEVEGPRDGPSIDEAATRSGATALATMLLGALS